MVGYSRPTSLRLPTLNSGTPSGSLLATFNVWWANIRFLGGILGPEAKKSQEKNIELSNGNYLSPHIF